MATQDLYILGIVAGVVAVLAFILYVWDRKTKEQPIEWLDAGKLALGAGGVAGGIAYAVGTEDAIEAVTSVATQAQEMFVGKPEF
jgi:phosphatidylglycerophosphatase A